MDYLLKNDDTRNLDTNDKIQDYVWKWNVPP